MYVCTYVRMHVYIDLSFYLSIYLFINQTGKMWLNLDNALQRLVEYWKTLVYDSIDARLESLFVSADNDQSGMQVASHIWTI